MIVPRNGDKLQLCKMVIGELLNSMTKEKIDNHFVLHCMD